MARSSDDLTLKVGFDIDKFQKELSKTNQQLSSWTRSVQSGLAGLVAGFSALSMGRFALDVSKLAGEAEGVNAAFVKLENSVQLMEDLKRATGGTVSELELMKRSVMASNFDISLRALPQLLEFATLRARQTGQSVNYLVDSIVTGIGRKSKLILDNLGISAVQLTEALGGASAASSTIGEVAEAVGKIASANLEKMGKLTNDAAVKADRLTASWENLKVAIGNTVNQAGLPRFFEILTEGAKAFEVALGGGSIHDRLTLLNSSFRALQKETDKSSQVFKDLSRRADIELKKVQQMAKDAGITLRKAFDESTGLSYWEIWEKEAQKAFKATEPVVRTVSYLNEQVRLLNEEIGLQSTSSGVAKLQAEIAAIELELNRLLNKAATVTTAVNKAAAAGKFDNPAYKKPEVPHTYQEDIKAMRELQTAGEDVTKSVADMSMQWASFGNMIGESIGDMINGTQTFAQAMAQMASRVIDSLFHMALANAALLASKFGPAAPFVFAASAGVLKAIFSNIGHNKASGTMAHSQTLENGQVVQFRIHGSDLVGTLDNYNRSRGRTGN